MQAHVNDTVNKVIALQDDVMYRCLCHNMYT